MEKLPFGEEGKGTRRKGKGLKKEPKIKRTLHIIVQKVQAITFLNVLIILGIGEKFTVKGLG